MATLSLRANLALAVVCAIGLTVALGLPWYGPADATDTSSIEHLFGTVSQLFTGEGVSAHEALGTSATVLMALAGAVVVASVLCLLPSLEDLGRTLLSLACMASTAIVVIRIFEQPGTNTGVDLRYGILVALACAGLSVCFASAAAAKPKVRKPPARMVDLHTA